MKQIIIDNSETASERKSLFLNDVVMGDFFNNFLESQKAGYIKPDGSVKAKGISQMSIMHLRQETVDILQHCNPHDAVNNQETTHLVVGYVQSGKTLSFTALTALAKDNGYRIVIYLAGTKKNLLDQTSERLEKDLVKSIKINKTYFKLHKDPTKGDAGDILGHLKLSSKPIILIPILKHYDHIRTLAEIFSIPEIRNIMEEETTLIIDDEADQASLNSFGRKNSKNGDDTEEFSSSTYSSILKLRTVLRANSYIQYTATPQANILISMQDILSPKSHTLLTPGEGYIGGKLYFGKGPNHDLFHGGLILTIPEKDVFHKKRNKLSSLPKSLKDAVMMHILAIAIVVKFLQVDDVNFLSMMVHVDNTKKWNKKFKQWIDRELNSWSVALDKPDGHDDKVDLLEDFEKLFPLAVQYYPDELGITFDKIKPYITDIINDKKVYLVNTDKDAQTKIEWDKFCMHILVGAEMLNRGFTIENLATTYMPRYSTSTTNADTIQQRCRFFGYKESYIKSCRVFLPEISIIHYMDYVDHEEELRDTLSTCDNLVAAERKLLLSPTLRPTRLNVLPVSVVQNRLVGISSMSAYDTADTIKQNDVLVQEFLNENKERISDLSFGETGISNSHRGFKLGVPEAIEFLNKFQFRNPVDAMRKAATIRYIRYLSNINLDPIKYVYFIEMAYKGIRTRPLNLDTFKLATSLFQGHSSVYKGDSAMVGTDSLTIQLHHIQFSNELPLGFPKQAYTLAINYPESLAVTYYENEKESIEEDRLDD